MTTDAPAEKDPGTFRLARLRRRADFQRASKTGARFSTRLFTLQMVRQDEAAETAPGTVRVGFTVTRQVAGAVGRNRIRRRLKEALRAAGAVASAGPLGGKAARDYVFVARRAALDAPFTEIVSQMTEGFARLDDRGAASPRRKRKDRPAAS